MKCGYARHSAERAREICHSRSAPALGLPRLKRQPMRGRMRASEGVEMLLQQFARRRAVEVDGWHGDHVSSPRVRGGVPSVVPQVWPKKILGGPSDGGKTQLNGLQ